jgi:hypothetical protein
MHLDFDRKGESDTGIFHNEVGILGEKSLNYSFGPLNGFFRVPVAANLY